MRKRVGRILAWVVAIALCGYVMSGFSFADVARALRAAAPWTVPGLTGLILTVYLADSFAIWKTFGWFAARLSFFEVVVVRGASYLLALLNYALGQGAIVYFVKRSRGVPVMRGTATVLLIMGINILMLLTVGSIGLLVAPKVDPTLPWVLGAAYAGFALYLVLVVVKPRFLTSKPMFDVLLSAGPLDYLKAMGARLPHIVSLMALTYTSMLALGVHVPLAQAVLYLPVVYFVAVLPISPQGLGTMEAAMTYYFAGYAPGDTLDQRKAAIFASCLAVRVIANVVQAVVGFICLRSQLAKDIAPPVEAEAGA
jgi:uncharacterized membrane protein YbhN (UPF0104 family)